MSTRQKVNLLTLTLIISLMANTALASENYTYFATLVAGQNYAIGYVKVGNDADHLYVKYQILPISNGWSINSTHLHVTTSFDDIPKGKSGNPKIGHFDFKDKDAFSLSPIEVLYIVPLNSSPGQKLYIAAHAVVQSGNREETAWGFCFPGYFFTTNNWATYLKYQVRSWVPDVMGMTLVDAELAITSAGLVVGNTIFFNSSVPAGFVISQNPPGGISKLVGTPVDLTISLGP